MLRVPVFPDGLQQPRVHRKAKDGYCPARLVPVPGPTHVQSEGVT